ncbi:MAG: helix-turn-helix domain-containing protein [Saprospiraceae bacterium]
MLYREFNPSHSLQPYIDKYILIKEDLRYEQPLDLLLLPNLYQMLVFCCRIDVPAIFSNNYVTMNVPKKFILPYGAHSFKYSSYGAFAALCVLFKPASFRHFFKLQLGKYLDRILPIEDTGLKDLLLLSEQVQDANSLRKRINLLDSFFKARRPAQYPQKDIVDIALKMISQKLDLNIHAISDTLKISERHLRRLFYREIGIQPKQYQRVVRIYEAFRQLKQGHYKKLGDIAYNCGYYDQMHFIDEFKYFTGRTPTEYLRELPAIREHFPLRDAFTIA